MKKYVSLFILLTLMVGCNKTDQKIYKIEDGTYTGTFQREKAGVKNPVAQVSLTIKDNQWQGSSNKEEYPALCHGIFTLRGDTIVFQNQCGWFANFDWSLILSGKYLLDKSGNNLVFHRDYAPKTSQAFRDLYVLKKQ